MSTQYNRKLRRKRRPKFGNVGAVKEKGTKRHRSPVHGVQQRAFRGPVRSCQPPQPQPKPEGRDLTGKLLERYYRLHVTPKWIQRIGELWKERKPRRRAA